MESILCGSRILDLESCSGVVVDSLLTLVLALQTNNNVMIERWRGRCTGTKIPGGGTRRKIG